MSLKLLDYCKVSELPAKIGLMGHANTSKSFQRKFRLFNGPNIIKMVDSGVFTKEGNLTNGYEGLFQVYQDMGAEYGIMIDVIKDKKKTIRSGKKAVEAFERTGPDFKLVGVAQGENVDEYLECYSKLKEMGFSYIAVGGLLKKVENTSRFTKVRDESVLCNVVMTIRAAFPKDWLFLLGCYHPRRHGFFREMGIFGADYKGWILNYTNPGQEARNIDRKLASIESSLGIKNCWLTRRRNIRQQVMLDGATITTLRKMDKLILVSRMKIAENIHSDKYATLLRELTYHLEKSADKLRGERFAETKGYLDQKVFTHVKTE